LCSASSSSALSNSSASAAAPDSAAQRPPVENEQGISGQGVQPAPPSAVHVPSRPAAVQSDSHPRAAVHGARTRERPKRGAKPGARSGARTASHGPQDADSKSVNTRRTNMWTTELYRVCFSACIFFVIGCRIFFSLLSFFPLKFVGAGFLRLVLTCVVTFVFSSCAFHAFALLLSIFCVCVCLLFVQGLFRARRELAGDRDSDAFKGASHRGYD